MLCPLAQSASYTASNEILECFSKTCKKFQITTLYAKKVIDSSYELADNYQSLFLGDNDNNGAQKEIIFAIRCKCPHQRPTS